MRAKKSITRARDSIPASYVAWRAGATIGGHKNRYFVNDKPLPPRFLAHIDGFKSSSSDYFAATQIVTVSDMLELNPDYCDATLAVAITRCNHSAISQSRIFAKIK
jgi:hypothetical protein